jgi:hypothetical protein
MVMPHIWLNYIAQSIDAAIALLGLCGKTHITDKSYKD